MLDIVQDSDKVRSASIAKPPKPFLGIANRVELTDVGLHFCSYGADTTIEFSPMEGFRQMLCLRGTGAIAAKSGQFAIAPELTGIVPPFQAFKAEYRDDYAQLVVAFKPQSLVVCVADFAGISLASKDSDVSAAAPHDE